MTTPASDEQMRMMTARAAGVREPSPVTWSLAVEKVVRQRRTSEKIAAAVMDGFWSVKERTEVV